MIRQSCLLCVLKHLGQAAALFAEARLGYPLHRFLAIGHMAEAESESLEWPGIAASIREERIKASVEYDPDIMFLIEHISNKLDTIEAKSESPKKSRRKSK